MFQWQRSLINYPPSSSLQPEHNVSLVEEQQSFLQLRREKKRNYKCAVSGRNGGNTKVITDKGSQLSQLWSNIARQRKLWHFVDTQQKGSVAASQSWEWGIPKLHTISKSQQEWIKTCVTQFQLKCTLCTSHCWFVCQGFLRDPQRRN